MKLPSKATSSAVPPEILLFPTPTGNSAMEPWICCRPFSGCGNSRQNCGKMQQRFSAIQLFCLFETSVRSERILIRAGRTDVTRSCADNGCRKISAVFCSSSCFPRFIFLHLTHLDQWSALFLQIWPCNHYRPDIWIFRYLIHNIKHKLFQNGSQSSCTGSAL